MVAKWFGGLVAKWLDGLVGCGDERRGGEGAGRERVRDRKEGGRE